MRGLARLLAFMPAFLSARCSTGCLYVHVDDGYDGALRTGEAHVCTATVVCDGYDGVPVSLELRTCGPFEAATGGRLVNLLGTALLADGCTWDPAYGGVVPYCEGEGHSTDDGIVRPCLYDPDSWDDPTVWPDPGDLP